MPPEPVLFRTDKPRSWTEVGAVHMSTFQVPMPSLQNNLDSAWAVNLSSRHDDPVPAQAQNVTCQKAGICFGRRFAGLHREEQTGRNEVKEFYCHLIL